jgi:hypothetical protein
VNILALDLATTTGWALLEDGHRTSGVQVFDVKRGESPGMRYVRLVRWLAEIAARAELIVYEQVVPAPKKFGGAMTREFAYGMVTHVQTFCATRRIEHHPVYPATLKRFVTGSGKANKAAMLAAALAQGWCPPGTDDNEVDAIALLRYAEAEVVYEGGVAAR